jgi:hypothetical protein
MVTEILPSYITKIQDKSWKHYRNTVRLVDVRNSIIEIERTTGRELGNSLQLGSKEHQYVSQKLIIVVLELALTQ